MEKSNLISPLQHSIENFIHSDLKQSGTWLKQSSRKASYLLPNFKNQRIYEFPQYLFHQLTPFNTKFQIIVVFHTQYK